MRLTLVCTQRGYTLADLGMQDGGSAVLNLRISHIRSRLDLLFCVNIIDHSRIL